MRRTNLPLFTAALATLTLAGCHSGGSDGGNLATVNGETIGLDEYHKYMERKPLVIVQTQSGPAELPVAAPLGFQALRDLINRRVLLQVAKDDGVFPTAADVDKELEFQRKRDPQFIQKLLGQGMTIDDIKRDLTLDLAKERVVTKGITVTPADADKFIKDNPQRFMNPEQAKLRVIAVREASKKASVDKDLAAGQPFPQVAVAYSIAPDVRRTQGIFPISNVQQMPPELQAIVRSTPEGKVADWKQFGNEWAKIMVEQKIAAKPVAIDDTMKESVRRALAMEKGGQATDLAKRLVDKLRTSKVAVTPPALKTQWDTAFKSLQESDVKASTGTGKATGGANAPK